MTLPENNVTEASPMPERHFITRDEFATTVDRLSELITEVGRTTSKSIESLRVDQRVAGRPQWQALTFGFGVFSLVLGALWAVYSTGEHARRTLLTENIELRGNGLQESSRNRHETQKHDIQDVQRRISTMELRGYELEAAATETSSRQYETLRWLEQRVEVLDAELGALAAKRLVEGS